MDLEAVVFFLFSLLPHFKALLLFRYIMFDTLYTKYILRILGLEVHKKAIHIKQFHKSVGPSLVLSVMIG